MWIYILRGLTCLLTYLLPILPRTPDDCTFCNTQPECSLPKLRATQAQDYTRHSCFMIFVVDFQCPYNEPEAGNVPGPGAYGRLQDNSSFSTSIRKTLTDEKIGFSSTGRRASPGPTYHTAGMPGPGQYDLDQQSIAGGLKQKSRIGCKGVFG